MQLTTAMLADGAHQLPPGTGKLYILGGQWDRITVAGFPAQHPTMAVVVVVQVEYSEALDPHQLDIALTFDGEPHGARATGQLITGHPPTTARGAPSFVALPITFSNLTFQSPGRYEWVVSVDGNELGRVPMELALGMTPPGEPPAPATPAESEP